MGLLPILSGLGHIIAGLLIRLTLRSRVNSVAFPQKNISEDSGYRLPESITERNPDLLEQEPVRENSTR